MPKVWLDCRMSEQLIDLLGSIELPLKCARDWDADDVGKAYWAAGCPLNDPRAEQYFKRTKCYDLVVDSISSFRSLVDSRLNAEAQGAALEEVEMLRASAYQLALSSPDDVFHSYFYDWLITKNMRDELLEVIYRSFGQSML